MPANTFVWTAQAACNGQDSLTASIRHGLLGAATSPRSAADGATAGMHPHTAALAEMHALLCLRHQQEAFAVAQYAHLASGGLYGASVPGLTQYDHELAAIPPLDLQPALTSHHPHLHHSAFMGLPGGSMTSALLAAVALEQQQQRAGRDASDQRGDGGALKRHGGVRTFAQDPPLKRQC